ncbi:MAG: acyl-CoA dehydratase activase-related protein [Clostridia bacterium]|jgi:predicted nucleotide-binding protein (sugar kinase/HSP70/actin superfamily)|nr:CoA protein activase [Clostridiales bacterium]
MKITFPHMGGVYIPLRTLFEELQMEVVVPPFNNDEMKSAGCKYAPEYSCLPFKLILGNMLHSLEQGADTVIMLGGSGPCRFGYFGHLLDMIARDLGYRFTFICLEPSTLPRDIGRFKKAAGCSYRAFISALRLGWAKLEAVDTLEQRYWSCLPYSHDGNRSKSILHGGVERITECTSISGVKRLTAQCLEELERLSPRSHSLPRVIIVGDIYTLNEPYSNLGIEELLARHGIETCRSVYTSIWVKNMLLPWNRRAYYRKAKAYTRGYLEDCIGGFAIDTIYHAISFADKGFDGIVHIFPVTCMPEIVSSQILQKVSAKKRIPIMSLTIDEHMEKTGMETRVEAFAELLHLKKTRP